MFEIKATTDAKVRDDRSEDLGAVDKPSLPPALPQHVSGVCLGVGGVTRQSRLSEQAEQVGVGPRKFILEYGTVASVNLVTLSRSWLTSPS